MWVWLEEPLSWRGKMPKIWLLDGLPSDPTSSMQSGQIVVGPVHEAKELLDGW
jgi:hypothetical protein